MPSSVEIADRKIGQGYPCFIVAEVGSSHCQSFDIACQLVRAAKEAGADAVKLQTYKPETMTLDSPRSEFMVNEKVHKGSLWDLYKDTAMPWDWCPELKALADQIGITLFSAPFDKTAVDFLDQMGVPCFKIASCELVDLPLIQYAASKGKPMILSTGMATWDEIVEAIEACRAADNDQIIVLKCSSAYPAPPEEMNLRTIATMLHDPDCALGYPIGLSDHTLGYTAALVAVTVGANLVEKHIKLDPSTHSPDSEFSLPANLITKDDESITFGDMVEAIREAEAMLGSPFYELGPREMAMRRFRRSLYAVADIKKGEQFTEANLRTIRPANGLAPKYLGQILGSKAKSNIEYGTPLSWEMVEVKEES